MMLKGGRLIEQGTHDQVINPSNPLKILKCMPVQTFTAEI